MISSDRRHVCGECGDPVVESWGEAGLCERHGWGLMPFKDDDDYEEEESLALLETLVAIRDNLDAKEGT